METTHEAGARRTLALVSGIFVAAGVVLAGIGPAGWLYPLGLGTMIVATVLSVVSGLGYIRAALPLLLGRAN